MQLKLQILQKHILISENNPPKSSIRQPVLTYVQNCHKRGFFWGSYVFMLFTWGISKPNFTLGVAKGQNIAPLAPSTWMDTSIPVSSWYLSRISVTLATGS